MFRPSQKRLNKRLVKAVRKGEIDKIQQLITDGANVSHKDEDDCTPLHYAVRAGHLHVIDELLRHGADIDAVDDWGHTPATLGSYLERNEIVKKLLKAGANPQATGDTGRNMLMYAASDGNIDLLKTLQEYKLDINARDKEGRTALFWATQGRPQRRYSAIQWLLDQGADPLIADVRGRQPRHIAMDEKDYPCIELLEHGQSAVKTTHPDESRNIVIFERKLADRVLQEVFDFNRGERVSLIRKGEHGPVEAVQRQRFEEVEPASLKQAFDACVEKGGSPKVERLPASQTIHKKPLVPSKKDRP